MIASKKPNSRKDLDIAPKTGTCESTESLTTDKKTRERIALRERPIASRVQKRDKLATMKLFQDAALEIIKNEGIEKLKINRLERKTGKSKRLVYEYFGGLDGLLQAVRKGNDPWLGYVQNISSILKLHKGNMGEDLAGILLKNHLVNFYHDGYAQQVSLMELSKKGVLRGQLST